VKGDFDNDPVLLSHALVDVTPNVPSCSPAAARVPESLTLGAYLRRKEQRERESVAGADFDAILEAVRAKSYGTMSALASACGKPAAWATKYKEVVLGQRLMTLDAWKACFVPRSKLPGRKIGPVFFRPHELAAPLVEEDTWSGFTDDAGYEESEAVVLERVRTRQFKDEQAMSRHYGKPIEKFRDGLIARGVLTLSQWQECFNGRKNKVRR
jgi:hypothetical protein